MIIKIFAPLKRKWIEYLLEITVIVVGIVIALMLDSWHEDRSQSRLEDDLLAEIRVGLERDLKDIEFNLRIHRGAIKSQYLILEWLNSEDPYADSLCRHFANAHRRTVFISNDGPYETLKSLGIRNISNDILRDKISELYDNRYDAYNEAELNYDKLITHMINFINPKYFDLTDVLNIHDVDYIGCMKPLNINKIRSENEYKYHINTCRSQNEYLTEETMVNSLEKIKQVITLIDIELNN